MFLSKLHFKYLLVTLCFFGFSFAEASTTSTTTVTSTGVSSSTVDMVVNQLVDNSCNENRICEIERGETVETCPTDCHLSHVTPEFLSLMNIGEPIVISNVEFTAVSEDQAIISWDTNKPTSDNIVFEDGMGGTEGGGYLDTFFTIDHSVILEDFDVNKEYYFKIFSQGIHGDDNYDEAKLFALRVTNIEAFEEALRKAESFPSFDILIDKQTQYLCEMDFFDEEDSLQNVCKIRPPRGEIMRDPQRPIYYDNHFLYDWGYKFKQFLYKFHILKRLAVSLGDYLWVFN